ncbi:MAG: cell division protein FtsK, partial [Beggiatoa sp. IS2]
EPEQVLSALQWCDNEMERRYRLMSSKGMRNIENYNQTLLNLDGQAFLEDLTANEDALPYIIVVIHEIAEIIKTPDGTQVEEVITHLAQRARAAGIHLILATQYPSVNVITGLLKTNMPTRIAFQVATKSESRAILGQMGAEILLGEGDMLYMTAGTGMPARVHGCFVSVPEVINVVTDLKARGKTDYVNPLIN